jgi:rhodanese-related sulfurtransferase
MVREVSPTEFKTHLSQDSQVALLDVRESWELDIVKLPMARHIPMNEIPNRLNEIDPNLMIVVMCHGGVRSLKVAQYLASQGYPSVANLSGGIAAWQREVDPTLATY